MVRFRSVAALLPWAPCDYGNHSNRSKNSDGFEAREFICGHDKARILVKLKDAKVMKGEQGLWGASKKKSDCMLLSWNMRRKAWDILVRDILGVTLCTTGNLLAGNIIKNSLSARLRLKVCAACRRVLYFVNLQGVNTIVYSRVTRDTHSKVGENERSQSRIGIDIHRCPDRAGGG